MTLNLINDDCLVAMEKLEANSVDAIVTDPPYELGFMGKKWDNTGIAYQVDLWQESLRILKPGGYLLSFGGTRTCHRMICAIEDAGFEIRDMIAWIYGSGFPKSLNIGKAVDKRKDWSKYGDFAKQLKLKRKEIKLTKQQAFGKCKFKAKTFGGNSWFEDGRIPSEDDYKLLKIGLNLGNEFDVLFEEVKRELVGKGKSLALPISQELNGWGDKKEFNITKGISEWEGWGTALKPALEPVTVARKPLCEYKYFCSECGYKILVNHLNCPQCKNKLKLRKEERKLTVAENVLKWGTGGINIDECRVGTEEKLVRPPIQRSKDEAIFPLGKGRQDEPQGRFPANLIHDGSDEVVRLFPRSKGGAFPQKRGSSAFFGLGDAENRNNFVGQIGDDGSASRFFYCAKASKSERNMGCEGLEEKKMDKSRKEGNPGGDNPRNRGVRKVQNNHPTVKPLALMEYLIKLVSKENAVILDPFMGSGTTGIACKKLNRQFIGIEKDPEYFKIAQARINNSKAQPKLL